MTVNYGSVARTLEEFLKELIEKGMTIPPQVVADLKTGRSVLSIYKRMPEETDIESELDAIADVEMKARISLQNVEMNLLSLADEKIGREYAEEWQRKINASYEDQTETSDNAEDAVSGTSPYITGVPKGEYFIRIKQTELAEVNGLDKLLVSYGLTSDSQADGYLLIYGRKEDVSAFLKEIRQLVGKMGS